LQTDGCTDIDFGLRFRGGTVVDLVNLKPAGIQEGKIIEAKERVGIKIDRKKPRKK
jgi:hypothetical protein